MARKAGRRAQAGRIVGLDIGASGVRAVLMKRRRSSGEWRIVRAASESYAAGVVHNGEVIDEKAFVKSVRRLWRRGRFGTKRVAFGLSDPGVITRQVDLPWMPAEDFATALRYQISDVLPVDLDTVELDYHVLAEYESNDQHAHSTAMNRILLVAANSALVAKTAELLRHAKLDPVIADTVAFALLRTACGGQVPNSQDLEVLVDIGADLMTVVIHESGRPLFMRTLSGVGSAGVTDTISSKCGITLAVADELKIETGLNAPPPVVAPIKESGVFAGLPLTPENAPSPRTETALAVNGAWAARAIGEIRNSVDYFLSSRPNAEVARIILAGRGSKIVGLDSRVLSELRIPVERIDVIDELPMPKRMVERLAEADLTVAVGLAMVA